MDIVDTGKGYLKQGRGYLNQKMHNTMIQHSVFAAIVFLIIAHPKTFQLVDSIVKVHDKNALLLIHAVVTGLIMYFGSIYLFEPVQRVLLGGGGLVEGIKTPYLTPSDYNPELPNNSVCAAPSDCFKNDYHDKKAVNKSSECCEWEYGNFCTQPKTHCTDDDNMNTESVPEGKYKKIN